MSRETVNMLICWTDLCMALSAIAIAVHMCPFMFSSENPRRESENESDGSHGTTVAWVFEEAGLCRFINFLELQCGSTSLKEVP